MLKDDILQILMRSRAGYISGADLARTMGVSRTAVWKHIRALESEGYRFTAVPSKGYRIAEVPDTILVSEVAQGLPTRTIGREIRSYPELASTNTLAMELAQKGAVDGAVVISETQSSGRGRLGRSWLSPRGNLYLSAVLRPAVPTHKAPLITLMGAVAVASSIRKQLGLPAGIKWPNDIMISGKKVSGLLTEMSAEPDRIRHIVLGIGVNVNMDLKELPPAVRTLSTTLAVEAGRTVDRTRFLRDLLIELDHWYACFVNRETDVLRAWETLNVTLGRRVAVSGAGTTLEGAASGIDAEGRLVLLLDDGTSRHVAAGDVTMLKR